MRGEAIRSGAWRQAMQQATEMRRRKTRESARAAERLWLALVLEALDKGREARSK